MTQATTYLYSQALSIVAPVKQSAKLRHSQISGNGFEKLLPI